jgi:L,D-transpeptidase-like protein
MKVLRYSLLALAGIITVALALAAHYYYKGFYNAAHIHSTAIQTGNLSKTESDRIYHKALAQRQFLISRGFNRNICFLIDMRLPSGKNRFFVYDLSGDSIVMAGLVAHGSANKSFNLRPVYSNIDGSSCTALGKYRIGKPYHGQFGLAYKLYGLDTSNDQAFNRNIVLHAFRYVPEKETDPYPICNSRGCPMVAPGFLKKLQPLIDQSTRPVMLYIFD